MDQEKEDQLQQAIEVLTKDKKIFMIAHRLKTVRNAYKIVVMDAGRIAQEGRHEELIRQEGIYKDSVIRKKRSNRMEIVK